MSASEETAIQPLNEGSMSKDIVFSLNVLEWNWIFTSSDEFCVTALREKRGGRKSKFFRKERLAFHSHTYRL